ILQEYPAAEAQIEIFGSGLPLRNLPATWSFYVSHSPSPGRFSVNASTKLRVINQKDAKGRIRSGKKIGIRATQTEKGRHELHELHERESWNSCNSWARSLRFWKRPPRDDLRNLRVSAARFSGAPGLLRV